VDIAAKVASHHQENALPSTFQERLPFSSEREVATSIACKVKLRLIALLAIMRAEGTRQRATKQSRHIPVLSFASSWRQ